MTILEGAFPTTVSPEIKALLEEHMHLSNAPSIHNEHEKDEHSFLALFTSNRVYQFADHAHQGHAAIHSFREFLYSNIAHRDHFIKKVFTDGSNDRELMAFGGVKYKFEDGSDHEMDWAGRYTIVEESGKLLFEKVQIVANPAHEEESKKP